MSCSPALVDRFPALTSRLRWVSLGQWPTPIERLAHLGKILDVDLWIKRDDLSGQVYGGNKVRKLEWLLADALHKRRQNVVTVGGIGSNHVVATAIYAGQLGMQTHAIVVPQPITPHVRQTVQLARSLEIKLIPCPFRSFVPLYMWWTKMRLPQPYIIWPGGSSPLGVLGYISAALELSQQIKQGHLPEPDDIFIALGSGGSMAGLVLGCALAGLSCRIIGVRVVERTLANATWVRLLIRRTTRLLRRWGVDLAGPSTRLSIIHNHIGRRYGAPTKAAAEALQLARETEGLDLETTYTAKALAALMDHSRAAGRGRRLLFWNTFNGQDTSALLQEHPRLSLPPRIQRWLD